MAFDSWTNPEVITAICVGIGTVLGAIATAFKKIKGKSWKEVIQSIHKEDFQEIANIAHEQAHIVEELIKEKQKEKKESEDPSSKQIQ